MSRSSGHMPYQADQEKNEENIEKNLGDSRSGECHRAEAQQAGDDGDDQKYQCVIQHWALLFRLRLDAFRSGGTRGLLPPPAVSRMTDGKSRANAVGSA